MANQLTLTKTLTVEIPATKQGDTDEYLFVASAGVVDREGDVLVPDGMDSTDYEKNPVVLWLHRSDKPAVARAKRLVRRPTRIEVGMTFPDRPPDHPKELGWRPDEFRSLVRAGLVNAVSVRATSKPNGWRSSNAGDIAKYGDSVRRVVNKWRLEEISLVPLPMNQDAVVLALGKGLVTRDVVERYLSIKIPESPAVVDVPRETFKGITIRVPERGAMDRAESIRIAVRKASGAIYA